MQAEQELARFAAVALEDTEDIWHALFRETGKTYREPTGMTAFKCNRQGRVVPDSFTRGTSEQRRDWLLRGFWSGDLKGGDTFSASV